MSVTTTILGGQAPEAKPAETAGAPPPAGQDGQAPAAEGAKKEAAQGGDTGKAGGAGEQPGAGAPLALKFPDGLQVDQNLVDGFIATATDLKLTTEQAQKIADAYVASARKASERLEAEHRVAVESWEKQILADKDLGGQNYDATKATARRAIAQFGTPGLRQLLEETGLGSNPEVVRFVARVGQALAEDSVAGTGAGVSEQDKQKARLTAWYPKSAAI